MACNCELTTVHLLNSEDKMKEFDTICAIATALGEGGIAIIRISGDNALDIAIKNI